MGGVGLFGWFGYICVRLFFEFVWVGRVGSGTVG